ncbi:MAG: sulfite exporter TauE/SafE family protein [Caldilineaceae bacterium]
MEFAWYIYVLAILAGILAGIINTLAGSGSLVTLPMLIFLGLPANVANGTNRVGVIMQNIVGITTYQRAGALDVQGSMWYTAAAVLGSLVGARIAVDLNEQMMNMAIGVVMIIMLVVILSNPKRWLREKSEVAEGRPGVLMLGLFFVIGIYGGFIQAGVGIFLLAALVMGVGYTLTHANAIKLVIVLALSLAAIAVFIINGQVNWWFGLLMAVGQSIGAWLAARFAVNYPNSNVWVRRLLIFIIIVSALKLFGVFDLVLGMFG